MHTRFLRLAAECGDPVQRMQHVVTFFIAGGCGAGVGVRGGAGGGAGVWQLLGAVLLGVPAWLGPADSPSRHVAAAHALPSLAPAAQPSSPSFSSSPPHPILPACPPGFHHAFARWAKPFNPILGETWEAALPDSAHVFLEQISHHPPITAFQLLGPHGLYAFMGQRCALWGVGAGGA